MSVLKDLVSIISRPHKIMVIFGTSGFDIYVLSYSRFKRVQTYSVKDRDLQCLIHIGRSISYRVGFMDWDGTYKK